MIGLGRASSLWPPPPGPSQPASPPFSPPTPSSSADPSPFPSSFSTMADSSQQYDDPAPTSPVDSQTNGHAEPAAESNGAASSASPASPSPASPTPLAAPAPVVAAVPAVPRRKLGGFVGFSNLPNQVHRKRCVCPPRPSALGAKGRARAPSAAAACFRARGRARAAAMTFAALAPRPSARRVLVERRASPAGLDLGLPLRLGL